MAGALGGRSTGYFSKTAMTAGSLNCSELQTHRSLTSHPRAPGAEPPSCCHLPLHGDTDRIYLASHFYKHSSPFCSPDSAGTGQHVQRLYDKNSPKRQSIITQGLFPLESQAGSQMGINNFHGDLRTLLSLSWNRLVHSHPKWRVSFSSRTPYPSISHCY